MQRLQLQVLNQHVIEPHIRSILVHLQGKFIFGEYYPSAPRVALHEVASVTKSFMSALIGIALQRGYLASIEAIQDNK